MSPSWSDLPSELLGVVLLHLPCRADRVYFGAACRSWRSAARAQAEAPGTPPQLPWLLLPSADAPSFVSPLAAHACRRLRLPDGARGARLCGSHEGGWLAAAADGWRRYELVSVFSGARVPLPVRLMAPRMGIRTCAIVRAVALSAPPTTRGCVAAALVCGVSNLAFARPGVDACWLASRPVDGLEDILYHDGGDALRGFHAVDRYEAVTVYMQESVPDAPALRMGWGSYRMHRRTNGLCRPPSRSSYAGASRYLVESRGKLLMVVRYYPSVELGAGAAMARGFQVLELAVQARSESDCRHQASWVDLDGGLDGRVLFLARGCSRAFEVSQFGGVIQEGIYFLDDTSFDISLALPSGGSFPCGDIGWYSGREITRGIKGFPPEFQSICSSPTWFYPQLPRAGTVLLPAQHVGSSLVHACCQHFNM